MKWFKHDSNALHDAKIEKLIMKFGIEGYGDRWVRAAEGGLLD